MNPLPYYREHLQTEFSNRIQRNTDYSVRAFARSLKLAPGSLSQIINGKRTISKKVAERILSQLELSAQDHEKFIRSVVDEKQSLGIKKVHASLKQTAESLEKNSARKSLESVESTKFAVISDWYHYAILEMTFKKKFKAEPKWIAERLGISPAKAKLALQRLYSLKLIQKNEKGNWVKTHASIDTKDKSKTSHFHREHMKQLIEKSLESLARDPIETRNHSGTTFCADPSRIPEAKVKIQKFLWELTEFLEGENPSQVYQLCLQLFPLEVLTSEK